VSYEHPNCVHILWDTLYLGYIKETEPNEDESYTVPVSLTVFMVYSSCCSTYELDLLLAETKTPKASS
jgi:hypothetical protein